MRVPLVAASLGILAACASPQDAAEPPCAFVLNQARTILDPDLDCQSAPQRVLCDGIRASNSISPEPFNATYNAEGRLAEYNFEPRGLSPERVRLGYTEGRLISFADRAFSYDERGRLTQLQRAGATRSFHYDELDRLIRLEDPTGFHGTSRFDWSPDGRLESIVSETTDPLTPAVVQTFEQDDDGRITHQTVLYGDETWLDIDFVYARGDLVQVGETALVYSDEPLDVPETTGLHPAWFLTGAQGEAYIRTGSSDRPWRVYLGDHPGGFVTAYPEFRSAHRSYGRYEMNGETVSATSSRGNAHQMTFEPPSSCSR